VERNRNYYREIYDVKQRIEHLREEMSEFESGDELKSMREEVSGLFKKLKELSQSVIAVNAKVIPVEGVPLPKSWNKLRNRHDKVVLMFQYYDEPVKERRKELLQAIHENIGNPLIDEVRIYLERQEGRRSPKKLRKDIDSGSRGHVKFVPLGQRLTYRMAIADARKIGDGNTVFLLCNNDCYFDKTVDLLRKVNFKNGNRLLCLTRKDQLPDGTVERGKSPPVWKDDYEFGKVVEIDREDLPFLDYNCSDAWAFVPKLPEFPADYQLGTFNCEYYFAEKAHLANVELRNPSEYIRCIHIHNTNFRREYALSNEKTSTKQNRLYASDPSERSPENWINGTWRIRSKYNYVDNDSEMHEYSDYVIRNFMAICEDEE
jgi:hypothetical protein